MAGSSAVPTRCYVCGEPARCKATACLKCPLRKSGDCALGYYDYRATKESNGNVTWITVCMKCIREGK